MKKALTILALSLALVLAVGLVACNDPTGGGSVNGKFDALNTTGIRVRIQRGVGRYAYLVYERRTTRLRCCNGSR